MRCPTNVVPKMTKRFHAALPNHTPRGISIASEPDTARPAWRRKWRQAGRRLRRRCGAAVGRGAGRPSASTAEGAKRRRHGVTKADGGGLPDQGRRCCHRRGDCAARRSCGNGDDLMRGAQPPHLPQGRRRQPPPCPPARRAASGRTHVKDAQESGNQGSRRPSAAPIALLCATGRVVKRAAAIRSNVTTERLLTTRPLLGNTLEPPFVCWNITPPKLSSVVDVRRGPRGIS